MKTYEFDYEMGDACATFKVDTSIFTKEQALATLEFFTWDEPYDEDEDPIDEVMKKYAIEAIKIATFNNYITYGVKKEFERLEGFCRVDGSVGIELIHVEGYNFSVNNLSVEIKG